MFDFELSDAEMAALAGLETGTRLGPDPDGRDARPRPGFSSAGGRWAEDTAGPRADPGTSLQDR